MDRERTGRRRKVALWIASLGLLLGSLGLLLASGVAMRAFRLFEPPPCSGDEACARWGADALAREATAARLRDVVIIARPLSAALARGDCAAAGELARALEQAAIKAPGEPGERM